MNDIIPRRSETRLITPPLFDAPVLADDASHLGILPVLAEEQGRLSKIVARAREVSGLSRETAMDELSRRWTCRVRAAEMVLESRNVTLSDDLLNDWRSSCERVVRHLSDAREGSQARELIAVQSAIDYVALVLEPQLFLCVVAACGETDTRAVALLYLSAQRIQLAAYDRAELYRSAG